MTEHQKGNIHRSTPQEVVPCVQVDSLKNTISILLQQGLGEMKGNAFVFFDDEATLAKRRVAYRRFEEAYNSDFRERIRLRNIEDRNNWKCLRRKYGCDPSLLRFS